MNLQLLEFKRHSNKEFYLRSNELPGDPNDVVYHKDKSTLSSYLSLFEYTYRNGGPKSIFEIGIKEGGSLALWDAVFGCKIVGIDIDINQISLQSNRYINANQNIKTVHMDSQSFDGVRYLIDREFGGKVDLFIDDGYHWFPHSLDSFINYWSKVASGGLFIIEDWGCLHRENIITLLETFTKYMLENPFIKTVSQNAIDRIFFYRNFIALRKI